MNMCIWMYQEFTQRFWGKIVWNFILKQILVSEKIKPSVKLTCVDEINKAVVCITPIECSAIGLLTLCLTETHTELRTQRVDLLENNIHYIQNSTSPISFKFRSQIKIPSLVPFVPVGV